MKRVIIIGLFADRSFKSQGFAEGFEQQGWEVIRVAADPLPPEAITIPIDRHLFHWLDYDYFKSQILTEKGAQEVGFELVLISERLRELKVRSLIRDLPKPDLVLLIQCGIQFNAIGLGCESIYYATARLDPQLPKGITGVCCAYPNGLGQYQSIWPHQFEYLKYKSFLPHAIDSNCIRPRDLEWEKRPVLVGHMGRRALNPHSKDEAYKHIYDTRNQVLNQIQGLSHIKIHEDGGFDDYLCFLDTCKFVLNVPGEQCQLNLRDYEAIARGAILIHYGSMKDLPKGFQCGLCNTAGIIWQKDPMCLVVEDVPSLIWLTINWKKYDFTPVLMNAYKWVQDQTWQHRAKQLLDLMNAPLNPGQQERENKRQYHCTQITNLSDLYGSL